MKKADDSDVWSALPPPPQPPESGCLLIGLACVACLLSYAALVISLGILAFVTN